MTGKDVYLQMTWSWPDKTWNILCSYCLQWNTSQSKFRNHYFLFLFAFSILSQLFLIWGCIYKPLFCHVRQIWGDRLAVSWRRSVWVFCVWHSHIEGWEPERRKWHFTNFTGEPKQKCYHSLIWLVYWFQLFILLRPSYGDFASVVDILF